VEPSNAMEMLLGNEAKDVDLDSVMKVLNSSAPVFEKRQSFYSELETMYRHHLGKKPNIV
jgi:hypothetical protein